jgi:flagellar hook-associated protein 3 FlgL
MDRIATTSLNRNILNANQAALGRLSELQLQLATQKRISKPSDDPVGIRHSMRLRAESLKSADYEANIDASLGWLDTSDSTFSEMTGLLQGVKGIAVQGGNDTLDANARRALGTSVDNALKRMVDLANAGYDGRYVFAGAATTTKPFALAADGQSVAYVGAQEDFSIEIGPTSTMAVSQVGSALFQEPNDVFQALIDLRDALNDDDAPAVRASIGAIDAAHDQVATHHGILGGRHQRLEMTQSQLAEVQINLDELISRIEDVDLPEVISRFQSGQVALQAGLEAGARVSQQTLLDFLR